MVDNAQVVMLSPMKLYLRVPNFFFFLYSLHFLLMRMFVNLTSFLSYYFIPQTEKRILLLSFNIGNGELSCTNVVLWDLHHIKGYLSVRVCVQCVSVQETLITPFINSFRTTPPSFSLCQEPFCVTVDNTLT